MGLTDWKNESGDSFEQHARNLLLPIYPWLLHDLQQAFAKPFSSLDILEIGCGPGFMNQLFVDSGFKKVLHVDLSFSMLQKAVNNIKKANSLVIQADAQALPLSDNRVDIVYSRGSLFFWENLTLCLKEIHRVLKPGGMSFIGGGYGLSTPEKLLQPLIENAKKSDNKKAVPRIDLDLLLQAAEKIFSRSEILQAPRRGFWLKSRK